MFTGKSTTTMSMMYGQFIHMIQFFFLCLYLWPHCTHAGYITWIPRSAKEYLEATKNDTCPPGLVHIYALAAREGQIRVNKTVLVCDKDGLIPGQYCVENNTRGVQPDYTADCSNFSTPCDGPYNKSESYKFPECFERYGGILSPKDQEERYEKLLEKNKKELQRLSRQIEDLEVKLRKEKKTTKEFERQIEDLKSEQKVKTDLEENVRKTEKELEVCSSSKEAKTVAICLLAIISILAIYILIIVFLVEKYYYKKPMTYKKFLRDRLFVNGPDIFQEPEAIPLTDYPKIEDSVVNIESPRKHNSDTNSKKVPIKIEEKGNRSQYTQEEERIAPEAQPENGQMEKSQDSAVNNESPRKQYSDNNCTKISVEIEGTGNKSQDAKENENIPSAHTKFGPLEKDQYSSVEDESPSEQYSPLCVNNIYVNDERGDSPDETGQSKNNLKDESPIKNTADNDFSVVREVIDIRRRESNFFVDSDVDIRQ